MTDIYVFKVEAVEKITDGDTYWLRLDVGFRQWMLVNVRLNGWDCPEMRGGSDFEKAEAQRAKDAATSFLSDPVPIYCRTEKDPDNFGRWLGTIWVGENTFLGPWLANQGLATAWPTRWREVYDRA